LEDLIVDSGRHQLDAKPTTTISFQFFIFSKIRRLYVISEVIGSPLLYQSNAPVRIGNNYIHRLLILFFF
jgi:hypothetical protein